MCFYLFQHPLPFFLLYNHLQIHMSSVLPSRYWDDVCTRCGSALETENFTTQFFWLLPALVAVQHCVIIYERFHNLSLFASWNAVFVCLLCKKKKKHILFESRKSGPWMTGIMLKWPSSKKCHQKAHSALLLMEIRLLTSFPFKIFSYHEERERAEDSRQKNPNAETSLLPWRC